jgi:hypothetical protein
LELKPVRGLVLFPARAGRGHRRRRLAFAAAGLVIAAALVWPLFPLGARLLPPLFGLPPDFAWVVLALLAMSLALAALYRGDRREEP